MDQTVVSLPDVTATAVSHRLFRLVKALNKAEKRAFRLYATRAQGTADSLFLQLFDVLDQLAAPDDERVVRRLDLTPARYANLKRHLYREVLVAVRLLAAQRDLECELREQLDFAHILYAKGLFPDALRTLARAKARAVEHRRDLLHFEVLEFEKLIEGRHVTRSRGDGDRVDRLVDESAARSYDVLATSELANVSLQIHGHYILHGHARDARQRTATEALWREIQTGPLDLDVRQPTFYQRIHRFQAGMWYHYILLELDRAERRARSAATLFELDPLMKARDPALYGRVLYYVSLLAYLRGDAVNTARYAERLVGYRRDHAGDLDDNGRATVGVYAYLAGFNDLLLRRDFDAADALGARLRAEMQAGTLRPSAHRVALFRYRLAAVAAARAEYSVALDHLNALLNTSPTAVASTELLINARLLHALCHEALGNRGLLEYDLANLTRFLRKTPAAAQIHHALVAALRRRLNADAAGQREALAQLGERVAELRADPFEAKALRYLDVELWLQPASGT